MFRAAVLVAACCAGMHMRGWSGLLQRPRNRMGPWARSCSAPVASAAIEPPCCWLMPSTECCNPLVHACTHRVCVCVFPSGVAGVATHAVLGQAATN
jgi:hypothetical protein